MSSMAYIEPLLDVVEQYNVEWCVCSACVVHCYSKRLACDCLHSLCAGDNEAASNSRNLVRSLDAVAMLLRYALTD